ARLCARWAGPGEGPRLQRDVLESGRASAAPRPSELRSGAARREHRRRSRVSGASCGLAALSHAIRRGGRLSERVEMTVDARQRALWAVSFVVLVGSLIAMVRLNRTAIATTATNNRYGFSPFVSPRTLGVDVFHP